MPNCKNCGNKLSQRKNKLGICKKCFHAESIGEKSLHWKGGRKNNNGYVMIHKPDHPNSDQQGYVREHRLIIEKYLGRYLKKDEIIHHKNGVKNDNRLENLLLVSKREHDFISANERIRDLEGKFV